MFVVKCDMCGVELKKSTGLFHDHFTLEFLPQVKDTTTRLRAGTEHLCIECTSKVRSFIQGKLTIKQWTVDNE